MFQSNTKDCDAENKFTDKIDCKSGYLSLSISGTWSGTVTLQRSFDGGENWFDVDTFTANTEETIHDPVKEVFYRVGIKTGDYTSKTAEVGLYK